MSQFSPKINLFERMEPTKLNTGTPMEPMRMKSIEQPETADFKSVVSGLVENLNTTISAPDKVMADAMMDKADIHDVMAALSKAEISVNMVTGVTTKIIQSYEKVMQIQI
ncbi:flagellar hook-basal body complex protein FliE [Candidatus Gastranaerophilus sp. (ex Termes propinquus)]|nr:flagellar hook-basal body complex protein FliE [Candidatus Gastranaerophilus sp. (ex Termes propinquus)]